MDEAQLAQFLSLQLGGKKKDPKTLQREFFRNSLLFGVSALVIHFFSEVLL
jgi:hypothetical protein